MRMSAYVTPSLRAVLNATSARACLSTAAAAVASAAATLLIHEGSAGSDSAPAATSAVLMKSRREVVISGPSKCVYDPCPYTSSSAQLLRDAASSRTAKQSAR